jgi:hypothetical protein
MEILMPQAEGLRPETSSVEPSLVADRLMIFEFSSTQESVAYRRAATSDAFFILILPSSGP